MYDELGPVDCRYHPGRFGGGAMALVPHWSCCGSEEQLGGCRSAFEHVPCETTRRAMLSFTLPPASVGTAPSLSDFGNGDDGAPDEDAPRGGGQTLVFEMPDGDKAAATASTAEAAEVSGSARPEARKVTPEPTRTQRPPPSRAPATPAVDGLYVCMASDTLRSVALRHGMSVEALAEMNSMRPTRCLVPGTVLRVMQPALSEEDDEARKRREMVLRFRRLQQCSMDEARYYIEVNDFDWDTAVKERTADVAWEREHHGAQERALQEGRAAEQEAALLVSALSGAASRGAKDIAWPTWLRPWEDQLVRRCLVGAS